MIFYHHFYFSLSRKVITRGHANKKAKCRSFDLYCILSKSVWKVLTFVLSFSTISAVICRLSEISCLICLISRLCCSVCVQVSFINDFKQAICACRLLSSTSTLSSQVSMYLLTQRTPIFFLIIDLIDYFELSKSETRFTYIWLIKFLAICSRLVILPVPIYFWSFFSKLSNDWELLLQRSSTSSTLSLKLSTSLIRLVFILSSWLLVVVYLSYSPSSSLSLLYIYKYHKFASSAYSLDLLRFTF